MSFATAFATARTTSGCDTKSLDHYTRAQTRSKIGGLQRPDSVNPFF